MGQFFQEISFNFLTYLSSMILEIQSQWIELIYDSFNW